MIKECLISNPKGEVLRLILSDPWKTGINVKNITGLGPPNAEIYSSPYGAIDGGIYVGSRVPTRNIVFTLGMLNNPSDAEPSRLKVYNFFRIKDPVSMVFVTDERALTADGYVESVEPDIFSKDETLTVSVQCIKPWMYTFTQRATQFSGVTYEFEFPFSSVEGSTIPEDLIEFGSVSVDTRTVVNYVGDIQTGFELTISFTSEYFHNIYIYNMDTRERITLYTDQVTTITGRALHPGDEIRISTISGNKTAFLLRNGMFTNVISMVDKNSNWFQLTKGDNIVAFASDYGVENILLNLTYQDAYAGI